MKDNFDDCKNQKVNHTDFFDKLIKSGELLKQEKIWNVFKNYSNGTDEIPDSSILKDYLKEKNINFDEETFNKHFPANTGIKYNNLVKFYNEEKVNWNK